MERLEFKLDFDSAQATENAKQFRVALEGTGSSATKVGVQLRGLGADLLHANAAIQLVRDGIDLARKAFDLLVDPTVRAGTEVLNLSRRFGVAVDDFSKFGQAAKAFGVPIEGLGFAFRGMALAIDKAQQPGSDMSRLFQKLGLDAKKLGTEMPTQALLDVLSAFAKFKNDPNLTQALTQVFQR